MIKKMIFILITLVVFITACGDGNSKYEYTGILEGINVKVPAMTGGKIVNIQVKEGEAIKEGQTIAIIDTIELGFNYEQLEAGVEELLVQTEIARTNLSRVKRDYSYIKEKYERISQLYRTNSISKQTLDDMQNKLASAESGIISSKQSLFSLEARRKQIDAQIKSIRKKINDAVIIAPISGIITSKYFELGEAVPPMSPIVEIININDLETKIYISEKQLPKIKYSQEVVVKVDGMDENFGGKIDWISPKAEFTPKTILTPETRTSLVYAVKISIENPDGILKHGMPVVIRLKNED